MAAASCLDVQKHVWVMSMEETGMLPSSEEEVRLDYAGATVSLTAIVPFVRLLEEMGETALTYASRIFEQHLEAWGLTVSELDGPTSRLPHALVIQLLADFTKLTGAASGAPRAATKLQSGDYELLEYLCVSSATLGEAIECLTRYYPLLISADLSLHVRGDQAELRFNIAPGLESSDAVIEFGLVSNFVMTALHLQLDENLKPPIAVQFCHARPDHASFFEDLFACPVSFGTKYNSTVFHKDMLSQPMRDADPALHSMLVRLADREMEALFEQSAFPRKVRAAISAALAAGASLEDVSQSMHMSPSTLRARLRKYGTTYSAVLERYRRDLAKRALKQSQLSISEVAHELGFAHPPAFNRAFRRWFGMTPKAYRQGQSVPVAQRLIPGHGRPPAPVGL